MLFRKNILFIGACVFCVGSFLVSTSKQGALSHVQTEHPQYIIAWDLHSVIFTQPKGFWASSYKCTPLKDTVALIQQLHKKGIKQVVFSNILHEAFHKLQKRFPAIFSCFDIKSSVTDASLPLNRKPFKKYTERLKKKNPEVPSHSIIFFDDKKRNVTAAKQHGLNAHIFTSAQQARAVLVKRGLL